MISCFIRFQGNEAFYLLYSKTKKKVRIFRSMNVDVGNVHQLRMPICQIVWSYWLMMMIFMTKINWNMQWMVIPSYYYKYIE